MAGEINEGLKKQRLLIKDIIDPFFKNNGFSRKGIKYIKKLDYFIIETEIQRQRYYKDDEVEKFRINGIVYSENSYKLFYCSLKFGGYCIQGEGSWITTDKNTNISELKSWLNTELNKLPKIFEEYNDVDKIIEKQREIGNNYEYAFLLKDNNKSKEFEKWNKETNEKIKNLNNKILELSHKIEEAEKDKNQNRTESNKLAKEIEYRNLWSERKSKEIQIESIIRFLEKINE
ncbi:MAG: hypothetical protein LBL00_03395 [Endomicrobium sp.]|nr:hypothetical protein [Endomicrobium sp.]